VAARGRWQWHCGELAVAPSENNYVKNSIAKQHLRRISFSHQQ